MQPQQSQTPQNELILAAATLAKSSPIAWQGFLKALAVFTETHKDNLVKSQVDTLQINQGRAQVLVSLTKEFEKCIATADAMNTGKK